MTTTAPVISIVMPNYNNEKFLPDTIKSIQRQTLSDYELIIYHDPSEDNSLEVLKNFAAKDWRIKLIEGTSKKGCAHAYNQGIDHARGKYIVVMDSDNMMAPELLQRELSFLEDNPEVNFVSCVHQNFGRYQGIIKEAAKHGHIATKLLRDCCFSNSMMVRREFFDITGLRYDQSFSIVGDYDLFLQALLQKQYPTKFAILDFIGIYYRVHDSNISHNMDAIHKHYQERIVLCQKACEKLYPQNEDYEVLASVMQYHMNFNFVKDRDLIKTNHIGIKNLLKWRNATIKGILQYQNINKAFLHYYFSVMMLKMTVKACFPTLHYYINARRLKSTLKLAVKKTFH